MSPFIFKTPNSSELREAIALRRDVFLSDVGHAPIDDLDRRAIHLVVVAPGRGVIAASRILGGDCRPFEFEAQVDLGPYVDPGAALALIGRLCVAPDFRSASCSVRVHLGMLKLAYSIARRERFSDFIMYTFDHLLQFYRAACFRNLNSAFFHAGYGRKMHLMHLNIKDFEQKLSRSRSSLARSLDSIIVDI